MFIYLQMKENTFITTKFASKWFITDEVGYCLHSIVYPFPI